MPGKSNYQPKAGDIEYVPVDEDRERARALLRLIAAELDQAGVLPAEQVITYGEQEN